MNLLYAVQFTPSNLLLIAKIDILLLINIIYSYMVSQVEFVVSYRL